MLGWRDGEITVSEQRASNTKLSPLKCEIVDGVLTISVSAEVVKYAT